MLHENFMVLCFTKLELMPTEVLHCGNRDFRPFRFLWPWTWPDDLHIQTWSVFPGDIPDVQIWTSYVKAFESYYLTDRHDKNYIPRCFVGGQKHGFCTVRQQTESQSTVRPVPAAVLAMMQSMCCFNSSSINSCRLCTSLCSSCHMSQVIPVVAVIIVVVIIIYIHHN